MFDVEQDSVEVTFTATALTGDPDLYVSYPDSDNPFPSQSTNDQKSRSVLWCARPGQAWCPVFSVVCVECVCVTC